MNPVNHWTVHDRYGNRIYMTLERWEHILGSRPWLADYQEDILNTLRQGRRKQDSLDPRKYKYYWPCDRLLPEFNHLTVVVIFEEMLDQHGRVVANNYVVTAWAVFIYPKR